jgi:hypothetical protein
MLLARNPDKVAGLRAGGDIAALIDVGEQPLNLKPALVSDQDVPLRWPAHLTRTAREVSIRLTICSSGLGDAAAGLVREA